MPTVKTDFAELLEPGLRKIFQEQYTQGIATLPMSSGQMAAYKAWDTRKANKQDHSKLDLEMTEMERAIKEAVAMVKND